MVDSTAVQNPAMVASARFHGQSKEARIRANVVLLLIVIAIFSTIGLILYAGQIVSSDTADSNILTIAETRLANVKSEIREVQDQILLATRRREELRLIIEPLDTGEGETALSDAQRAELDTARIEMAAKSKEVTLRENDLRLLDNELFQAKSTVDRLINSLSPAESEGQHWTGSVQILLTAGLTRLAVMVLSIYLVRILVQLYQYNVRLSARYLTLAHALELDSVKPGKVREIAEALDTLIEFKRPEFVDNDPLVKSFGRAIETAVAGITGRSAGLPVMNDPPKRGSGEK